MEAIVGLVVVLAVFWFAARIIGIRVPSLGRVAGGTLSAIGRLTRYLWFYEEERSGAGHVDRPRPRYRS